MGGEDFWRDVFFSLIFVGIGIWAIWKGRIEIEFGGGEAPMDPSSPWYRVCVGPVARYGGAAMVIAGALVWVHWLLGFFAFAVVATVMWLLAPR